jgi:hypothetical protein
LRDISFPRLGVFYCSVVSSDFSEFVFDFFVGRLFLALLGAVVAGGKSRPDAANW